MKDTGEGLGWAAVTGSSRGLGFSIALRLAQSGFDLILINRPSKTAEIAAQRIREETGRVVQLAFADLTNESECVKAVANKQIQVLVNCGIYQGPGMQARIDSISSEELQRTFQANVLSQVALIKTVLPSMVAHNSGRIFQMVSGSSRTRAIKPIDKGGFQSFAYVASKTAIAKLVPLLALELADHSGLMFFNIDPGLVITDKMRAEGTVERFTKWGIVPPEHTADVVAYLATQNSDETKKANGAEYVDAPALYQKLVSSKL